MKIITVGNKGPRRSMNAREIQESYSRIEYLFNGDGKWYKLMDYFPWCFGITDVEDAENIVVLDSGGPQGGIGGHFKITDGKLWQQDLETKEWVSKNEIRILPGDGKDQISPITAAGEPFEMTPGQPVLTGGER
jgi:hypothetical protein